MTDTKPPTAAMTPQPGEASLETFRTLSLPEKALTIAQAQAMLFSNTVMQVLSAILRGTRPNAG